MALPEIVSPQEWLAARKELLVKEKKMRRALDALNAERRRLPMTEVTKDYRFTGPDGEVTLLELFGPHLQLIVQHVMFDPEWEDGCPSCTASIDEFSPGLLRHLSQRETRYVFVGRAPYEKIAAYAEKRGWDGIPQYSSFGSDFNYDFHVTLDGAKRPVMWNYRDEGELRAHGQEWLTEGSHEQPGMSCFLRSGDRVFHTYSTFARGGDFGGSYSFLDLTALGRQEDWEEPKGRVAAARAGVPDFD